MREGHPLSLWLNTPHPVDKGHPYGFETILIYPMHQGKSEKYPKGNWARPGDQNGWDGNLQRPTFNPSIDCSSHGNGGGWHGYIVRGRICDCNSRPLPEVA